MESFSKQIFHSDDPRIKLRGVPARRSDSPIACAPKVDGKGLSSNPLQLSSRIAAFDGLMTISKFGKHLGARIIVPFEGYADRYDWHRHIPKHENHEINRPYEVVQPTAASPGRAP